MHWSFLPQHLCTVVPSAWNILLLDTMWPDPSLLEASVQSLYCCEIRLGPSHMTATPCSVFPSLTTQSAQFFSKILLHFLVCASPAPKTQLLLSCSVVSDSFRAHELQHARLPCPSQSLGVCSNSCPLASMIPSNHLILCCPFLLLPSSVFPSISVFSNESALHTRWPKYWSFSFSSSLSNEYTELISFRSDWFDLLAVHGTLKSLIQHHSSKASVLRHSVFLMVELSHPYMTTGKTTVNAMDLCRQSDVSAL